MDRGGGGHRRLCRLRTRGHHGLAGRPRPGRGPAQLPAQRAGVGRARHGCALALCALGRRFPIIVRRHARHPRLAQPANRQTSDRRAREYANEMSEVSHTVTSAHDTSVSRQTKSGNSGNTGLVLQIGLFL
jgi:hypothetical protein